MKKNLIVILIAGIVLFCGVRYYVFDKQLYYYGENTFPHNIHLPFGFKTDYWGTDLGFKGFVLLDTLEFVSIANDTWRDSLLIDSVIAYGFRDNFLTAIVTDRNKQKYAIVFSTSSLHYDVYPYIGSKHQLQLDNLTWVDVSNQALIQEIKNRRANYSSLIGLILLISGFYIMIKSLYKRIKRGIDNNSN